MEGSSTQFWKSIRKMKCSAPAQPPSINGVCNDADIAKEEPLFQNL